MKGWWVGVKGGGGGEGLSGVSVDGEGMLGGWGEGMD